MKNEKILLDTNLLVYAFSKHDDIEKMRRAKDILKRGLNEEFKLCFSVQNISEFSRVMIEKYKISGLIIKKIINQLVESSFFIYPIHTSTVENAVSIVNKNKTHFWDAQITAVMKENGIKKIYTENLKDFENIKGIKVLDPFS